MRNLDDGSQVFLRRSNNGYSVEHYAPNGMLADSLDCEDYTEAKACFNEHPSNW